MAMADRRLTLLAVNCAVAEEGLSGSRATMSLKQVPSTSTSPRELAAVPGWQDALPEESLPPHYVSLMRTLRLGPGCKRPKDLSPMR